MPKFTLEVIHAAIAGFEQQKRQIDDQIAELRSMLPGNDSQPRAAESGTRKRRISAAGRRRIAAAQKARWAKRRSESPSSKPAPSKPAKKRRISPEGMARIIAATKKRWAAKRAGAAKAKKTAPAQRKGAPKKVVPAAAAA